MSGPGPNGQQPGLNPLALMGSAAGQAAARATQPLYRLLNEQAMALLFLRARLTAVVEHLERTESLTATEALLADLGRIEADEARHEHLESLPDKYPMPSRTNPACFAVAEEVGDATVVTILSGVHHPCFQLYGKEFRHAQRGEALRQCSRHVQEWLDARQVPQPTRLVRR